MSQDVMKECLGKDELRSTAERGKQNQSKSCLDPTKVRILHEYECVCVCTLSHSALSDSATPWPVACQAPLLVGFSRQEYWSGLPFPPPGEHKLLSETPCLKHSPGSVIKNTENTQDLAKRSSRSSFFLIFRKILGV